MTALLQKPPRLRKNHDTLFGMYGLRLFRRACTLLYWFFAYLAWYQLKWIVFFVQGKPKAMRQQWLGHCVLQLFRRLGATFIKVGQIMSTRPDLFPTYIIDALTHLQDNVGPFDFKHVQTTCSEDLGGMESHFAQFDPIPIASASVSQVHRAQLHDGEIVAVKIRRPYIVDLCDFDLRFMKLVAQLLQIIPSLALLAPVESLEQFAHAIRTQLDFTQEAKNNRRFRENFKNHKGILFPKLHDALCTKRILTMQFIEGRKIVEYSKVDADPKKLGKIGFQAMLQMVFQDGFVHADLHPGNVLVTRDHRLALLDVGMVAELTEFHRQIFAFYFAAWAQGDGKTMAQILLQNSPSGLGANLPGFTKDIEKFVAHHHGKLLGEVQVAGVVFEMLQILRKHRVRVNPTFTMVNIAIALTEGIGKQLDPGLDLLQEALPFFVNFQPTIDKNLISS